MRISDWSSDVCSSDLALGLGLHLQLRVAPALLLAAGLDAQRRERIELGRIDPERPLHQLPVTRPLLGLKPPFPRLPLVERGISARLHLGGHHARVDRKSTRLNSSH